MAAAAFTILRPAAQADLRSIGGQNVLLITIDTLRVDALSIYGGRARTPALDRLATDGVRFDFAHAHAVVTLVSHASILTGMYPFQHGLRDNSGYRLRPGTRTAATLLHRAGYATAAFIGAFPLHSRFGLNQSFDVYDDRVGELHGAPTEFALPERPAPEVVGLARRWIGERTQRAAGQPWFVWVHVFDPHAPYRPPPPYNTEYAAQPYYGEVAATDAALAPLVDDVRNGNRTTLVIVTGDHGEALGDHGEASHGLFAYESTLRVPLIIAEIGGDMRSRPAAAQGEVSSIPARHIDVLPTLLEAVGLAIPADLPGRSLLAAQERRGRSAPRPTYFEAMSGMLNRGWAPLTGVLVDRDKYVDLPIPERYDLSRDREERSNLATRSPRRDRELLAALHGFNPVLPGQRLAENPAAAAELRALGYVSGDVPQRAHYTEADDPKQLVQLDRAVHDAVDAFGTGRLDEAVKIYQDVIGRRPDMAVAYQHLGFIEWQRGETMTAIELLRRGIRNGAADTRIVAQLGGYLTDTGRVDEAIRLLEPLAIGTAADADALNSLGIAYARAGRREDARRIFRRVVAVDPESSIPLENLGMLALDSGELDTARQYFDRAVQVDPRSSRAHAGAGNVALRRGDHERAIAEWSRAVQLDPRNADALYNAGTALARDGHLDEARPYLERFLNVAPAALYAEDLRRVEALLASSTSRGKALSK